MKNSLAMAMGFLAGCAVGAAAACKFFKEMYENIAEEEIASVREFYKEKQQISSDDSLNVEANKQEDKVEDYSHYNRLLGRYSGNQDEKPEAISHFDSQSKEHPYVISPDEFGEIDEYSHISLTYYADQILADDNDNLVDDIDETIGIESLSHFGEYEDDSVYVRNDALKCDYEILLDNRKFSEVLMLKPPSE